MKRGLKTVVGKQIVTVVVATSEREPRQQVYLVFSDGTSFEFFGPSLGCCRRLDTAANIEEYVESRSGTIERVYGDVEQLARNDESIEMALLADLQAWRQVKDVIDKARARPS